MSTRVMRRAPVLAAAAETTHCSLACVVGSHSGLPRRALQPQSRWHAIDTGLTSRLASAGVCCAAAATPAVYDSRRDTWRGQAGEPLVVLEDVGRTHDGERWLFQGLTATISRGDKVAVTGANGAGKTSLLRLLSGDDRPEAGHVQLRRGSTVGYVAQEPSSHPDQTALQGVLQSDSSLAQTIQNYERAASGAGTSGAQELLEATEAMEAAGGWAATDRAMGLLCNLNVPAPATQRIREMSGGQRRRVALAAALLADPIDLLILDEPTNHLDFKAIAWLEEHLARPEVTLVLVTHDRYFMERLCTRILEVEDGRGYLHAFGGPGSYERYRQARAERRSARAAAADNARVLLRTETEWMRRQPKARSVKSRSRIGRFYELTTAARDRPEADTVVQFSTDSRRQGSKVLKLENVSCGGAQSEMAVIRNFWYEFQRGECIGVVGPNGAGKTTLLDMIAGKLEPHSGLREVGETTQIGYLQQDIVDMPGHLTLLDYLKEVADVNAGSGRQAQAEEDSPEHALGHVGFQRSRWYQQVDLLSGGERRRLQLASVLLGRPNLLLLDEPTNDLSLQVIESLEGLLRSWNGCLILATHDRALLQNLASRLFVVKGDGLIRLFDGTYSDYLEMTAAEETAVGLQHSSDRPGIARGLPAVNIVHPAGGGVKKQMPTRKLKIGFRELEEYGKLEQRIESMTQRRDALAVQAASLAADGDFEACTAATAEQAELDVTIDIATERWLTLAELVENSA